jgi:hypothetical protein
MDNVFRVQEVELLSYLMKANTELAKLPSGFNKEAVMTQVRRYLNQAGEGYQNIAKGISEMTDREKAAAQVRLRAYRQKYNELKLQIDQARCFGTNKEDNGIYEGNLERTLEMGEKSYEIGIRSLSLLKGQQDKLSSTQMGEQFSQDVNDADSALTELTMKKVKLKVSMLFIILLEFLILLLILYLKLG